MEELKRLLTEGDQAYVLKCQQIICSSKLRGVADLYHLYTRDQSMLCGAQVAAKIVGRASASLMIMGGVKRVFARTISTQALTLFAQYGIEVSFDQEVPFIINRNETGWCPMEKLCYLDDSLSSMFLKISGFVTGLRFKMISVMFLAVFINLGLKAEENIDTLSISKRVHAIDELTVTGARREVPVRMLPLTISVVNKEMIEERQQPSLLPLLSEQVPGLFITGHSTMGYGVAQGASGTMSMRGIGGQPTTGMQVLIDGIPQNMGLMGHPIADIYQSMLAERVEVVRGPASVLYGSNAMGGVINVVTPRFDADTSITKAKLMYGSYQTLDAGIFNRFQKGKFSSKVTAAYNRTDGHRSNMDFDQYSTYAKVGYAMDEHWRSYADFNLTHFNISNPGPEQALINDNDSEIRRGMTAWSLENDYSLSSGAIKLFYNWGRHIINDGYAVGGEPRPNRFNSKDVMAGVSLYQSLALWSDNTITVGADYFHFGGEAWSQFPDKRIDIADKTDDEMAAYLDVRQSLGEVLSLDAGLRYDYHTQSGKQWIPQGGLSVHLSKDAALKAMVSKGFRNPTLKDLYLFGSQNPDLLPECIVNYELSWSQTLFDKQLSYSVNVFYLEGDNMIQTVFQNGRALNVNTGEVANSGFETAFNYRLNASWSANANYSYLTMKHPVLAAPEHKVYAELSYAKGKLKMSTGIQYVAGLYVSTAPEEKEDFLLWNMRAMYQLSDAFQLSVRGDNLLGLHYEINKGYEMPLATFNAGIHYQF